MSNSALLTTGQVSQICGVASRTVTKWIDSGKLDGFKIPGSKDRRVTIECLNRFMRANNMPMSRLNEWMADRGVEATCQEIDKIEAAKQIIIAAIAVAGPGRCKVSVIDGNLRFDSGARENFLDVLERNLDAFDRNLRSEASNE